MSLSYKLSHVCGNVFENGNLCFTSDGNSIISPVGNRISVFDLVHHKSTTFPFENRKNIARVCLSNDSRFLITVDVDGHSLFINFHRKVVLTRHNFRRKVYDISFSPDDKYFAVTFGHGCQIWKTPSASKEFSPLTLSRNIAGHHNDVTCLDWSTDSQSLIMGSKDLTARIYSNVHSKYMSLTVLSGHRDKIMNVYFSNNNDSIYSIAKDGAIFTWKLDKSKNININETTHSYRVDHEEDIEEELQDELQPNKVLIDAATTDTPIKRRRLQSNQNHSKKPSQGNWQLETREFLWDIHTSVSSSAFNKANNLLVVGFQEGVFAIYEMPGCINIHRLTASNNSINTCCINTTGEWLALGSTQLGQLLVWEWKSESYVLKQQGHLYGMNTVDFSDDGMYMASGGDDAKVKLWNTASGFCFCTLTVHVAPVTGVRFIGRGAGKAILSCSLDGSVRAHDLLRYRNFRTLTSPTPVQFTSLCADVSGEVVCAGAMDPFQIYVWALQTGHLLDILSGHEGPIACLDFSSAGGLLVSGSWDGTMKIWDVYKNNCTETLEHGCDVLAVAVRPDGKELCSASTNGCLYFWDMETGSQVSRFST